MSKTVKKHVLSAKNYTPLPERNIMEAFAEDAEESEAEEGRMEEEEPAVSKNRSEREEKTDSAGSCIHKASHHGFLDEGTDVMILIHCCVFSKASMSASR